jgi:hypothetical protein
LKTCSAVKSSSSFSFFIIFRDLLTLRHVGDELGQLVDEESVLVSLRARVKKKICARN